MDEPKFRVTVNGMIIVKGVPMKCAVKFADAYRAVDNEVTIEKEDGNGQQDKD